MYKIYFNSVIYHIEVWSYSIVTEQFDAVNQITHLFFYRDSYIDNSVGYRIVDYIYIEVHLPNTLYLLLSVYNNINL